MRKVNNRKVDTRKVNSREVDWRKVNRRKVNWRKSMSFRLQPPVQPPVQRTVTRKMLRRERCAVYMGGPARSRDKSYGSPAPERV